MCPLALTQTREALIKILDDLSPHDQFDLISFSSEATTWKPLLVPASTENVNEAKSYATGIQAQGGECLCSPAWWTLLGRPAGSPAEGVCHTGTNINDAMLMAVQLLEKANQEELLPEGSITLIILLTDGDPTVGEALPAPPWCTAQKEKLGFSLACCGTWGREKGLLGLFGSEIPEISIEPITVFSPLSETTGSRGDQPFEYPEERAESYKWPA